MTEHDVQVLEGRLASQQAIVEKITLHLGRQSSTQARERLMALKRLLELARDQLRKEREQHVRKRE